MYEMVRKLLGPSNSASALASVVECDAFSFLFFDGSQEML